MAVTVDMLDEVRDARFDDQAASIAAATPDVTGCCESVAPILARVGDKWSMLIVMLLIAGPVRFNELKRRIGTISQRMLSLTLRGLERDGLVSRTVTPSVPPRVDYALTPLGYSLSAPIRALGDWAHEHHPAIAPAQRRYHQAD